MTIEDKDNENGLFDEWEYTFHEIWNNRPRFVYSLDANDIYSDIQYDYNDGWIIEIRIGAATETVYASDRHGKNPPGNKWIAFRALGSNRRLLQAKEFFIAYLINESTEELMITSPPTQSEIVGDVFQNSTPSPLPLGMSFSALNIAHSAACNNN